jgi:hypothetical protein
MEYNKNDKISQANERGPRFYSSQEEQELARLREALARTDEEKFYHLMNLMKLQRLMSKAKFIK